MNAVQMFLTLAGGVFGYALEENSFSFVAGALIGFLFGKLRDLQKQFDMAQQLLSQLRKEQEKQKRQAQAIETLAQMQESPQPGEQAAGRMAKENSQKQGEESPARSSAANATEKRRSIAASAKSGHVARKVATNVAVNAGQEPATEKAKGSYDETGDAASVVKNILEYIAGINTAVLAGVIILFIGIVFLLKYAIEHSMVPIELRLAASFLLGAVLVVLGFRLKDRRWHYAVILQGGGLGILYLTVFVSFKFYALISAAATFVALVFIVALGMFLSAAQNAMAMALISAIAGFAAPVLASTGQGNYIVLFGYYLVLDLGILFVAYARSWRLLNLIAFFFTFGVGAVWGARSYQPDYFAFCLFFLTAFFIIFSLISVLYAIRRQVRFKGYIDTTLVFALPVCVFGLQYYLLQETEYGLSIASLLMGGYYLALSYTLLARFREPLRDLLDGFLALGIIFANLSIPLALNAPATSAMWAMEGAALVWVSLRQGRMLVRIFGVLLQAASWSVFLEQLDYTQKIFFNGQYFGFLIIVISSLISAWLYHRKEKNSTEYEPLAESGWQRIAGLLEELLRNLLLPAAIFFWLIAGLIQADILFEDYREYWHYYSVYFSATATGLAYAARKTDWRQLNRLIYGWIPLLVLLFLFNLGDHKNDLFDRGGWVAWVFHAAALSLTMWLYRKSPARRWKFIHLSSATLLWVFAIQCSYEIQSLFPDTIWGALPLLLFPAAMLFLVSNPRFLNSETIREFAPFYAAVVAAWWAAQTLLVLLWVNLQSPGVTDPIAYLFVLNPLDLFSLLGLGVTLRWYLLKTSGAANQAPPDSREQGQMFEPVFFLFMIALFSVVNMSIARLLHHSFGVAWYWDVMYESMAVQMTYSIVWGVAGLCLTIAGNAYRLRQVWVAGAFLLGLAVFKLFFIDLSNTQTVLRIVTFVAIGILLLLVGYFAPVPPENRKENSKENEEPKAGKRNHNR